jgi:Ca2+-binding EF-hand superfamily protein
MLNKILSRSVSAAAFTVAMSMGVSAQDFGAWDTDDDGVLSETEFGEGLDEAGLFDQWDSNDDSTLDQDEVLQGIFHTWDTSNNGELSVSEWDDAVDLWFGEADVNLTVENWDTDGDGAISPFEFIRVRQETTLLSRIGFDTPRDVLAQEDFRDGLFGIIDADGDA